MSNTDFDPSFIPDPTSFIANSQRAAVGSVATSGDDNPDDAARAIDVAKATGVPAPVVHDDLDHYEAQLKSRLSTDIVANNPDLQAYVNSHPLAAKVSNDDWGALDKASESIKALNLTTVPGVDTVLPMGPNPSLEELAHNFKAGFGDEPLGAWGAQTEKSREFIRQYPYSATLAGLEGLGFELPARIMGGLASAVFGPEKAQALMDPGLYASLQGIGPEGAVMEAVGTAFAGLLRAAHAGKPWLEAGKVPPVGIDPLLDQAHALQAKADAEKLTQALKDSASTATLERSPELFADYFVRQITEGEVGIPAEVARKNEAALSKIIPDFETKLANAGEGDVMLTAGQYLSNPDVMKDLVDDTRVREGGLTANGAKELPKYEAPEEPVEGEVSKQPTPIDTLRQAAALEPIKAEEAKPTTAAKQLELPVEGTTRMVDTPPFEGAAPGLTKRQTQKYGQLIAKRVAEDQEYLQRLEEEKEAKRQSKAFKERKIELQPEVEQAYAARPDVALEAKLREGNLSLDPASLTEAQRAAVPKEWLREGGATPQDLAYAFGTSPDILDRTLALKAQRDAAGMRPGDFDRRMIAAEADRRANAEISGPSIEEIKDYVVSQTQEDMLHEQTLALAEAAGEKFPIKSAALKEQVVEAVRAEGYKAATRDKYLAEAGRAGRKLEDPALQGDPAEQFRLSQAQEIAFMKARYAKTVEKAVAKAESLMKKYSKREVDNRLPEYVNAIHSILAKLGQPIGRLPEDLAKEMTAGVYKDLNDFIAKKQNEYEVAGIEFPVADFLLDPDFKKQLKDFTAGEMEGLAQSLTTLDHRGRVEDQVIREGKVFDRKTLIKDMNQQLADKFGIEAPTLKDKSLPKRFLRQFWAGLHAIETVFGRFDGRDPEGIFTRTFTYPGARALNDENVIQRELSGKYRALGEVKKPNEVLEHPFVDQLNGTPRRITRANLDNIIANIGNKYNRERMAYTLGLYSRDEKGKIVFDTDSLMKWVELVATPEEITRAQRRGDEVWSWLKGKDDNVYRQIYGVAPEDIPLDGFSMHGKDYDGWYHPVIADDERAVKAGHRDQDRVTKPTSFWPSTRNSFTKRRTGNIERLSIEPGRAELVMSQMVHDIALREYVDEISKIVNDDQFRLGITRSYGKEYHDVVKQWLWNVAGNASYNAGAIDTAAKVSNFFRQNVISTYIAFNLAGTVLKHGPTALVMSMREGSAGKFLKNSFNTYLSSVANKAGYGEAFMNFLGKDPALGESIWEFVQRYSEEIQRRDRNYMETMSGSHDIVFGRSTLRNRIMQWGAKAVSFSDMLSAVPLWYTKYNEVLGRTGDHYQSVQEADLAVRNAHGSTSEMSRPLIVDHNSALAPWFTSLYGFFGANMQQKIKLMHDLNDTYKLGKAGEIKEAAGMLPGITASTLAYVIAPVVVEEAVTSQFSDDRRGLGHKALSWALLAATNSVLGLRDLSWGLENNQEPSAGLISSPLKDMYTLYQRVTKPNAMTKANAGKLVESFLTTAGDATGMMPKPVARAARGMIDVYNQQQHPRTTGDWYRLLMHGNTQRHITRR